MKSFYLIAFLSLSISFAQAQVSSTSSMAVGGMRAVGPTTVGYISNPAQFHDYKHILAASYRQSYGNTGIPYGQVAGMFTLKNEFQLGGAYEYRGIPDWTDHFVKVQAAKQLHEAIILGVGLITRVFQTPELDNTMYWGGQLGAQFLLMKNWVLGFNSQLTRAEDTEGFFALGTSWKSQQAGFHLEFEQTLYGDGLYRIGFDYQPVELVSIMGGAQLSERVIQPSLGIRFSTSSYHLDLATRYHPYLPLTWSAGLHIQLPK